MNAEQLIQLENLLYWHKPEPCRHTTLPAHQWNGQHYCGECCGHVFREMDFVSDGDFCGLCGLCILAEDYTPPACKPAKVERLVPKLTLTKPGARRATKVDYDMKPYRYASAPVCAHNAVVRDFMTGVYFCTTCFKETVPEPRHEPVKWYSRRVYDPRNPLYDDLRRRLGRRK